MSESSDLWNQCSEALRDQVAESTWRTWLAGLEPVGLDDDVLLLSVPSTLVRDRVETRFLGLISSVAGDLFGRDITVQLKVAPSALPVEETGGSSGRATSQPRSSTGTAAELPWNNDQEDDPGDGGGGGGGAQLTRRPPPRAGYGPGRSGTKLNPPGDFGGLDPRYVFDTFVIGSSNRFAHAAALAVAEKPARSYNPLFIHGGAGLGKTHLLHAIGHYIYENFTGQHVRYVSTETFMNEFVDAIRANATTAFKKRYRECDVLLIDDVQFIEGKESLQEEFFHTFNHLYGASKQIVLTSDRPPKSIATLEDRLRSRFLSGLITDVQPPELETRLAILMQKVERESTMGSPPVVHEVLEFIATNVKDNIRELEGALIRVTAYGSLNQQPVTRELAEHVLTDIVSAGHPRRITPKMILEATSVAFGFSIEDICGSSRRRPLVISRQVGMYVFRELTDYSYPAIAREFGGRDHSTVMHAVDKISSLMKERRQIYDQVTELILRIKAEA